MNILSLDAPLVAVVWQGFLAQLFETPISLASRFVLGLTIWLAYVADRWLDGRMLSGAEAVTLRHQFSQRHARQIAIAWLLVFAGDFLLALIGLTQREFVAGLAVGAMAAFYLVGVQWKPARRLVGALKEVFVAILFALGAGVFVFSHLKGDPSEFVIALSMFTILCLLNCLLVSSWERPEDARQAQLSMAIRWNLTPRRVRWMAVALIPIAGGLAYRNLSQPGGQVALAVGMGCLLLALLELSGGRMSLNRRRVLADAALLSPLLVLLLLRAQ